MPDPVKNASSGSDDSDDDYVPDEKTGNASEEADSGDAESDLNDEDDEPKTKRRKSGKQEELDTSTNKTESSSFNIDALWEDFKKEPEVKPTKIESTALAVKSVAANIQPKPTSSSLMLSNRTSATLIPPTTSKSAGGLAGLLGKLGKKDKLSTLEKSKLDWNNFKRAEGIEEDLTKHNKGKDGFLEKRDFLERTDMRQFELEKAMRTVKRSAR